MDAFISYRRAVGFMTAQVIHDRLTGAGISCFMDLEEGKSGHFDEHIREAIREAPNFVLLLSEGTLDRCTDPEDWVRQEILEALDQKKNIIPVWDPGFVWPENLTEALPEKMRGLRTLNGVVISQEYFSSTMENLVGHLVDLSVSASSRAWQEPGMRSPFSQGFLRKLACEMDYSCRVDMAFHAGAEWRQDTEKLELLTDLMAHQVPVRVLVNRPELLEPIASHMRQPMRRYVGFEASIRDWKELEALYPELLQVRVLELPMLHRIYHVRPNPGEGRPPVKGAVSVRFYTYGNYNTSRDLRRIFTEGMQEYELFSAEFDYLWKLAEK